MADTGFSLNTACVSLLLMWSTVSVTRAQTFQKPSLDTPTAMVAGTQYTISCSSVSTGAKVSLAWMRSDNQIINPSSTACSTVVGDTKQCHSVYEFKAKREDNGVKVICTAIQNGNPENKSGITTLNVMARPQSNINNRVVSAHIGMTVNLTCETDANPPATVYDWFFDGVTLNETGSSLLVTPTNTSFGEYICNATNTIGTSDPIVIILEEKPLIRPHSNISNSVIEAIIGMTVTLDCQTVANPPATVYNWSFNDVTLNETGSSLVVNLTDVSFFGEYTCVATNTVGTSDPIVLTLKEKTPSPSSSGHSVVAGLNTLTLILIILHIVY